MDLMRWRDRQLADPWDDLRGLQREINALFDFGGSPASAGLFDRSNGPALDVVETPEAFVVACELPGMEGPDVDVQVAENVLTIKGEKKEEAEDSGSHWYKRESRFGSFQRTLPLPAGVDASAVTGEMENGLLRITLPKREERKPRQIAVKAK